jgi:hypothetical protein
MHQQQVAVDVQRPVVEVVSVHRVASSTISFPGF